MGGLEGLLANQAFIGGIENALDPARKAAAAAAPAALGAAAKGAGVMGAMGAASPALAAAGPIGLAATGLGAILGGISAANEKARQGQIQGLQAGAEGAQRMGQAQAAGLAQLMQGYQGILR